MKSKQELLGIVSHMENTKLLSGGHGYKEYGDITIGEAAKLSLENYANSDEPVAFTLIEVVLSARANYEKMVAPRMKHIRNLPVSKENSLERLKEKLLSFDSFYELCDINSQNKYQTLCLLIKAFNHLKILYSGGSEYDVFHSRAINAQIDNKELDVIGMIPRIGIATFQHLRMNFGANTVKPDQRVCEVLEREFGYYKIDQVKAIKIVEQISEITGYSALHLDQIMVKYGSSVYNLT